MFRLRRPPAGPHFPRLKLQHHETMLAQISASNLQFLLTRTPVMQSIDLRATRSRLTPYLSSARYHAPGPKVTDALPPRNGQGNGSHMPNRPCLCGCNACNGPIPLWPPPSDFCLPNHPNQARPNRITTDQTASNRTPTFPTLPSSDT